MYKVFINEKKLTLSKTKINIEKSILFENKTTLEMGIDLLENTSLESLNIYGENIACIWETFTQLYRNIEAAGGIVSRENNELLFIKRMGKWDLPKGKMEKGETREESAIREIEEETNLKNVSIQKFINTTYHIYTERNSERILKHTHWFAMTYKGKDTSKPQKEEGITEISWKTNWDIQKEVYPNTFKNILLILEEYHHSKAI